MSSTTRAATLGGIAVILGEFALSFSDYRNNALAVCLAVLATALFLPLINETRILVWTSGKRTWGRYGEPHLVKAMILLGIVGAISGSIFFVGIGLLIRRSQLQAPAADVVESVTTQNIEEYVEKWLHSLTGNTVVKRMEVHPGAYFVFLVTFDRDIEIAVSRAKQTEGALDTYLLAQSKISMSEKDRALLDSQSHSDQQAFARAVLVEAARANMDIDMQAPYHSISVRKLIPIQGLTGDWFKAVLHSLRMEDSLIVATEIDLLNRLKQHTAPPSSP